MIGDVAFNHMHTCSSFLSEKKLRHTFAAVPSVWDLQTLLVCALASQHKLIALLVALAAADFTQADDYTMLVRYCVHACSGTYQKDNNCNAHLLNDFA